MFLSFSPIFARFLNVLLELLVPKIGKLKGFIVILI